MSKLVGAWDKLESFLNSAPLKIKQAGEIGSKRAGALLSKRIKEGLRNQAPGGKKLLPLSALTVWTRDGKGTKPLIATGALLRSVTWQTVKGGVWVGSNRRDESGKYNIAAIHEKGCTIKVNERMRKGFVGVIGRQIRKETEYIYIPARPFIGPVVNDKEVQQELRDEYINAVQEVLRP